MIEFFLVYFTFEILVEDKFFCAAQGRIVIRSYILFWNGEIAVAGALFAKQTAWPIVFAIWARDHSKSGFFNEGANNDLFLKAGFTSHLEWLF